MKCFHEIALDCCDSEVEDLLVVAFLRGMIEDYHVHLEYLSFASFLQLTEAAKWTNREKDYNVQFCSHTKFY